MIMLDTNVVVAFLNGDKSILPCLFRVFQPRKLLRI
jgi:predicted nucleic acid-binding protein